jgi:hypothetical protein
MIRINAVDLSRTIEDLDGERWGDPDADATSLIRSCHALRQVPIGDLSIDDLRLLLGQEIGAEWLVPLALDYLRTDPLAGVLYPGDLLHAVLRVNPAHWESHPRDTHSLWVVREALEAIQSDTTKLLQRDDWPAFG